jgi:DNA-binding CsgD family transcriptional regulator
MNPEERAAIDAYLANGGAIQRIPTGHSGEVFQWDEKAQIIRVVTPVHKQKHFGFGNKENLAKANRERARVKNERREVIRKLHAEGKTNAEIACFLGTTPDQVRADVKRMGLASNPHNAPRGVGPEVVKLLEQGYSRYQVAATLGVSIKTVQYHDIKRRAA